jgi:hypothetical protein
MVMVSMPTPRVVALPLRRDADAHEHRPRRVDRDVRALEGTDPGAFDVRAETDADRPSAAAPLALCLAPFLVAQPLERALERHDIVGGVVRDRHAVAILQPRGIWHLAGANHVAAAQLGRIEREPPRGAIQQPIQHKRRLGSPRAAIRGGEVLVRDHVEPGGPVVRHAVRPGQMVDRVERDRLAQRRRRAVIARELGLQRDDGAVPAQRHARLMRLVAVGGGGQQVLVTRLDPLDRPAEVPRHRRHQDLLGIDVALHAEATSDVGHDDAHVRLGQAKRGGDGSADGVRHLRRAPDRERRTADGRRGRDAARFDRHAGHTRISKPALHDLGGLAEAACGVPDRAGGAGADIARPVAVHARRAVRHRLAHRHRGGQLVVVHEDGLDAVRRAIGIGGDDGGDGLTDVADARAGQHAMVVRREMPLGNQRRDRRGRQRGEVGEREHRNDAVHAAGACGVDRNNAGVGVKTADDAGPQHARQRDVVHEAPRAAEQPRVFLALEGPADGRRGHADGVVRCTSRRAWSAASA